MSWDNKNTKPFNKNRNRQFSKNAAPIDGIVSAAIKRHGIGWQIRSAMTVKKANEILDRLIEADVRNDLRALSFAKEQLTIACRHSAASHLANSIRIRLQEELESEMGDITVTNIYCKIDPHLLDSKSEIGV